MIISLFLALVKPHLELSSPVADAETLGGAWRGLEPVLPPGAQGERGWKGSQSFHNHPTGGWKGSSQRCTAKGGEATLKTCNKGKLGRYERIKSV